jgi:hypothetical protein
LLSFGAKSSSRLLSKNINIKIYRTIILLVVLYGCETWSLTLREEHRLRAQTHPVFLWRTGGAPEAMYNLLDFKNLCYENNVKISELTSSYVTGEIKAD